MEAGEGNAYSTFVLVITDQKVSLGQVNWLKTGSMGRKCIEEPLPKQAKQHRVMKKVGKYR